MAIHVRNVVSLDNTVSTGQFWSRGLILMRELFLAGRWVQSAISNGATWDANIVLNNVDCVVNPASPARITSVVGGFTGYEDYGITLIGGVADDDNNRGVYRIATVIDDNTIEIEPPPPNNWVADTGMTCRVFNWGLLSPLSNAEYVVMDPPTGNNQAYLSKESGDYNGNFHAHPRGDYPANPTANFPCDTSSSDRTARWNAYFDGSTAAIYWISDAGQVWWCLIFGELEDAASGDLYPGFVSLGNGAECFDLPGGDINTLYMLYDNGGVGQQMAKVANVCRGETVVANRQNSKALCRVVKEKVQIVKPWVYAVGSSGGFHRGRHPFRTTNEYWENWRPVTSDGTWRHLEDGGVFPMNGVNDPRPISGVATV